MPVKLYTAALLLLLATVSFGTVAQAEGLPMPFERIRTVVIDAGHGGEDSGALGVCGTQEKDLVLEVVLQLRDELAQRWPGLEVVLTREDDRYLGLSERVHIANQARGDVFVSIHFNSATNAAAQGIETFFIDPRGLTSGDAVPGREAEGPSMARLPVGVGGDVRAVVLDELRLHGAVRESALLAESVQQALLGRVEARDRGVRQGRFRVLRGIRMPAIVAELGFLSNPEEGARIADPEHRAALVEGLIEGLVRWDRASHVAIAEWQVPEAPDAAPRGIASGGGGTRPVLRALDEPAP